jgi:hypothetical protein
MNRKKNLLVEENLPLNQRESQASCLAFSS